MLNFAVVLMLLSAQPAGETTVSPLSGSEKPLDVERLYGPTLPEKPKTAPKVSTVPCRTPTPADADEIVVCVERSDGYRINPDILKAQRQARDRTKPKPPERMVDTSCQTVGQMGCINAPTIDILSAAYTAATMVKKALNGENVGRMFITQPELSEYELYLAAKREREAEEAQAEAIALAKEKMTDPSEQ